MDLTLVPRENLYRGLAEPPTIRADEQRADAGDTSLMTGHFAVFNDWTEIHSWFEGDFLESLAPGCFTKTFAEASDIQRVQFDHGYDSFVGSSLLGPVSVLTEDAVGAYYEVPLLDTDYNRDRVLPMLSGKLISGETTGFSLLGASFRFRVIRDEWNEEPGISDHNPTGLPERTIKEVRCFEFGPVPFPAYESATAGIGRSRSLTDYFLDRARQVRSANRSGDHAGPRPTWSPETVAPATGHPTSTDGRSVAQAITDIERLRRRSA